ncbi:MAG: type II toxin-antitoxin system HicB family antitoxin [Lachnospiraceae bacterium]|nr:type II toxin-antitoxin system HicB family antitoxin [Lachnospiraceae bacterium]
MNYIYTAVFTPNEDSTKFYARIPDLPSCITTGYSLQDAITQITDAASGWLVVAEDEDLTIPSPTPQTLVERGEGDFLSLISVDTIKYRAETETKAVRKNVSLPQWMALCAEKRGLNCSQILQEGLMQKLRA